MSHSSPDFPKITITKIEHDARIPQRAYSGDVGLDLFALTGGTLRPNETKLVHTGIAIEFPPGYYGQILSRSGLASKHSVTTLSGVIDTEYRGPISVILHNLSQSRPFEWNQGDAIGQILPIKFAHEVAFDPPEAGLTKKHQPRNTKGIGSSSRKRRPSRGQSTNRKPKVDKSKNSSENQE